MIVVNAYEAIFGFALEMAFSKVLLPAFGKPTSPVSAINFRSNLTTRD